MKCVYCVKINKPGRRAPNEGRYTNDQGDRVCGKHLSRERILHCAICEEAKGDLIALELSGPNAETRDGLKLWPGEPVHPECLAFIKADGELS